MNEKAPRPCVAYGCPDSEISTGKAPQKHVISNSGYSVDPFVSHKLRNHYWNVLFILINLAVEF